MDGLVHAPVEDPDVVGVVADVFAVGRPVVGVELVDGVELGERREELGRADRRAPGLGHHGETVGGARPDPRRVVGLGLGVGRQLDERDRRRDHVDDLGPGVAQLLGLGQQLGVGGGTSRSGWSARSAGRRPAGSPW